MTIGFLGPKGSFCHYVATTAFPNEHLIELPTITDVIKSYEEHNVNMAIVPVENSLEGSVRETLDYMFQRKNIQAVAEIVQPISQQLLVTSNNRHTTVCDQQANNVQENKQTAHRASDTTGAHITHIFSHPQALAQSRQYLQQYYPHAQLETTASTASAARYVAKHPDKPIAAIGSQAAADEYGLQVIAANIQQTNENYTRFWVLGSEEPQLHLHEQQRKITFTVVLPNRPGSLNATLSAFAWRGINLTAIESRPLKTTLGEYFFIIETYASERKLLNYAFEELQALNVQHSILGEYNVYTSQSNMQ